MSELWIRKLKKGTYRASVQRRYGSRGFTQEGNIKHSVIVKDSKKKGKIGKQARAAKTLRKLRR